MRGDSLGRDEIPNLKYSKLFAPSSNCTVFSLLHILAMSEDACKRHSYAQTTFPNNLIIKISH